MNSAAAAYLDAAAIALDLLRDPAVGAAWDEPSALPEFSVGGLAGHLAHQVLSVPAALAAPVPDDSPIPLLEHYERAAWRGADPSAEVNVGIRTHADGLATEGIGPLVDRFTVTVEQLRATLAAEDGTRPVRMAAGPWSLRVDDFLVTRMMELAVHSDDLAVSVGITTPECPDAVLQPVLGLLTGLAVRRHGQPAVLRALSRAERAPAAINAI